MTSHATTYAGQKGRAAPVATVADQPTAQRELSPAEAERVAVNRQFIIKNLPEAAALIKDLYSEGLIDGWRSVKSCKLIDKP